jgi:hypothetical protein
MTDRGFDQPACADSLVATTGETMHCPVCGVTVRVYAALPTWCPSCNWNLQTGETDHAPHQSGTSHDRLSRDRTENLKAAILADPSVLEHLPPARDALAIAAISNSFSIASFVAGVVLVGWYGGFIGILVGLFLIAGGLRTFVHIRRLPVGHKRLPRSVLPETFALIDEICSKLGVNAPQTIELTAEHRIVGEYRLRGSSLHVGVPLVRGLSGEELAAAFAQALAALAFRSGPVNWFVENARRSLHQLSEFLNEEVELDVPDLLTSPVHLTGAINNVAVRNTVFGELIVSIVRSIVRRPARWLASTFTARSYKRTHLLTYRSDAMAATATSPHAVVGALSAEVLETSVRLAIQRHFLAPGANVEKIESPSQLWAAIDEHVKQLPATESLRLLRRSSLTGHTQSPELPPIGYRVDILNVYNSPEPLNSGGAPLVPDHRFETVWTELALHSNAVADEFAGLFDRSLSVRR